MSSGKKRRYGGHAPRNPKRGAPGIVLTCESGREIKCEREALDILQHDWDINVVTVKESGKSTSLDDELEKLKGSKIVSPFSVYATGCRGMVVILCTDCRLIVEPLEKTGDKEHNGRHLDASTTVTETEECGAAKKPRLDGGKSDETSVGATDQDEESASWDPLEAVGRIVKDMESSNSVFPSSRFITRMIPMQATMYASVDDIRNATESLIVPFADQKNKTFAIQVKRRLCDHLKRDDVIAAIGPVVSEAAPTWKVNLRTPDFTIVVEICKTFAGVSILSSAQMLVAPNFNLAELRERKANAD